MKTQSLLNQIRTYPVLTGILIAFVFATAMMVTYYFFPQVVAGWRANNEVVRSIWCTVGFFALALERSWSLRRQKLFWATMVAFFILHTCVITYYSLEVHPLTLGEWIWLLAAESLIFIALMTWLARLARHALIK